MPRTILGICPATLLAPHRPWVDPPWMKPPPFRHACESRHPGQATGLGSLDSRFRGNDACFFLLPHRPWVGPPWMKPLSAVLAGLGPAIHEFVSRAWYLPPVQGLRRFVLRNSWMPGPRPGMTQCCGAQCPARENSTLLLPSSPPALGRPALDETTTVPSCLRKQASRAGDGSRFPRFPLSRE